MDIRGRGRSESWWRGGSHATLGPYKCSSFLLSRHPSNNIQLQLRISILRSNNPIRGFTSSKHSFRDQLSLNYHLSGLLSNCLKPSVGSVHLSHRVIFTTLPTPITINLPVGKMSVQKWSKAVNPVLSTTLDLPPSCIEFVPRSRDKLPCFQTGEYFVVGTYHLQKEAETPLTPDVGTKDSKQPEAAGSSPQSSPDSKLQSRNGSLNLFKLTGHKFRAHGQKL